MAKTGLAVVKDLPWLLDEVRHTPAWKKLWRLKNTLLWTPDEVIFLAYDS
jgi:hypothetical protein